MKKIIMNFTSICIVTIVAITTLFIVPINASDFPDVPTNHTYADEIRYIQSKGYVNGYTDGNYYPENSMIRATISKIVIEAKFSDSEINSCLQDEGYLDESSSKPILFPDVAVTNKFAQYICMVKKHGIAHGYSDGLYRPQREITLEESLKITMRALDSSHNIDEKAPLSEYVSRMNAKNARPSTISLSEVNPIINRGEYAHLIQMIIDNYNRLENDEEVPMGEELNLKIYVAGESVEEFNNFEANPFNSNGSLVSNTNNTAEYGWIIPFQERLKIREPELSIDWVGSRCLQSSGGGNCSSASLTNSSQTGNYTSAKASSSIPSWQSNMGHELENQDYCYDIGIVVRGGNDLSQRRFTRDQYKDNLRELILDVEAGSNCRNHPVVYVSGHLADNSPSGLPKNTQTEIDNWLDYQEDFYLTVSEELVAELNNSGRNIRLLDMWSPIVNNTPTTAFPSPNWLTTSGPIKPILGDIHRDGYHPKRLASIYLGESAADQININELYSILN